MSTFLDLKQIRKELGFTQKEMADFLGVTRNYIYLIESGSTPFSEKMTKKIESFLAETAKNEAVLKEASNCPTTTEQESWQNGQIAAFEKMYEKERERNEVLIRENAELKRQLDCANQKLADLREARGAPPMESSAPDAVSAS